MGITHRLRSWATLPSGWTASSVDSRDARPPASPTDVGHPPVRHEGRGPLLSLACAALLTGGLTGCLGGSNTTPTPATSAGYRTAPGPSPSSAQSGNAAPSGPSPAPTETNPAGDIPDTQRYVPFTVSGVVSVRIPEGWAQTGQGKATAFGDKLNSIKVAVTPSRSAPSVASVNATELTILRQSVPRFAGGQVVTGQRAQQSVVIVRYQGDSPQDPVTGKVVRDSFERYSYFHRGMRVDLTLSGPISADNVDPWRLVSNSVSWR